MSAENSATDESPNPNNTFQIAELECDSNDENGGNIIIEVSDLCSSEIDQFELNTDPSNEVDSPDFITLGVYKTGNAADNDNVEEEDTVALCETLYESESNDYSGAQILEDETSQFITIVTEPSIENIIEDIPNEVLVYTCPPESSDKLARFPCKSCDMVAGCIFCLKSHYESVHLNLGLIQYKCQLTSYLKNYTEICHKCNLVCESKQEMFDHRKIHFVSCDVCDMSFDSALFLSNHCKITHEKFEVIISCDLCEQWFKQLQDLSDHYQDYHEMILCIVCFKRFSNIVELNQHHGTHKIIVRDVKPVLPYACSKCNMAFKEITDLSTHLVRDHPNQKARYGSITRRRPEVKSRKKTNVEFDDCGGLSQEENILDMDENGIITVTASKKVKIAN